MTEHTDELVERKALIRLANDPEGRDVVQQFVVTLTEDQPWPPPSVAWLALAVPEVPEELKDKPLHTDASMSVGDSVPLGLVLPQHDGDDYATMNAQLQNVEGHLSDVVTTPGLPLYGYGIAIAWFHRRTFSSITPGDELTLGEVPVVPGALYSPITDEELAALGGPPESFASFAGAVPAQEAPAELGTPRRSTDLREWDEDQLEAADEEATQFLREQGYQG